MGAWGAGSFENDDAMDFASEIEAVGDLVDALVLRTPGDPVDIMLGEQQATPEQRQALRKDMGLDLLAPQRFVHFLQNAAVGNFGISYFHRRPVIEVIMERLPATIELTLAALVIGLVIDLDTCVGCQAGFLGDHGLGLDAEGALAFGGDGEDDGVGVGGG